MRVLTRAVARTDHHLALGAARRPRQVGIAATVRRDRWATYRAARRQTVTVQRAEIVDVIVDCDDPHRVARFWAALLGRPIDGEKGPYVWLERRAGVGLGFQQVLEPKGTKNRVHVDVAVGDLSTAVSDIEALGGRRVPGYEQGGFLVMADPEGNEFCLIPQAPFEIDDEGNADYLTRDA
jgi:hypothetical protein